jgi:hypothetical protein
MLSQVTTTVGDSGEPVSKRQMLPNPSKASFDDGVDESAFDLAKQHGKSDRPLGFEQSDVPEPGVETPHTEGITSGQGRLTLKNVFKRKVDGLDLNEL